MRRESTSDGVRIALLAFGSVNSAAAEVAEKLNATHINMRSVKPLDRDAVLHAADEHELLVTLEENVIAGGAGSAVNELLNAEGVQVEVLNLACRTPLWNTAPPPSYCATADWMLPASKQPFVRACRRLELTD